MSIEPLQMIVSSMLQMDFDLLKLRTLRQIYNSESKCSFNQVQNKICQKTCIFVLISGHVKYRHLRLIVIDIPKRSQFQKIIILLHYATYIIWLDIIGKNCMSPCSFTESRNVLNRRIQFDLYHCATPVYIILHIWVYR